MRNHPQQMMFPMIRKPAPSAQAHSGVALFIATLTILIALVALRPTQRLRTVVRAVASSWESIAGEGSSQRVVATKFAPIPARGDLQLGRILSRLGSSRGYEWR
jgi:hypothetical protein